jgi:hypothetical protein
MIKSVGMKEDIGSSSNNGEKNAAVYRGASTTGKGLTNFYIERVLHKFCSDFCGTYSCDNIPIEDLLPRNRYSIVCNTSPSDAIGEHFVTILVSSNAVQLFDPLLLEPGPEIARFLDVARCGRRRVYLRPEQQQQHPSSFYCGFFSILAALYFDGRVRGKPADGLRLMPVTASSPSNLNERRCLRLIAKMLLASGGTTKDVQSIYARARCL